MKKGTKITILVVVIVISILACAGIYVQEKNKEKLDAWYEQVRLDTQELNNNRPLPTTDEIGGYCNYSLKACRYYEKPYIMHMWSGAGNGYYMYTTDSCGECRVFDMNQHRNMSLEEYFTATAGKLALPESEREIYEKRQYDLYKAKAMASAP
ncbi:MAG: hypothetical protein WC525_10325 [Candidatus Thermoplasmatota archaeon]